MDSFKNHKSFCALSTKGSVPRISKNIFKKVSQKVKISFSFWAMGCKKIPFLLFSKLFKWNIYSNNAGIYYMKYQI